MQFPILSVEKGSPDWLMFYNTAKFVGDCYDSELGGFAQTPGLSPTLLATRMALHILWWGQVKLETEAIPRFKVACGDDAFAKVAKFVSARFRTELEERDGQQVAVGGFDDPNDGVNNLRLSTTKEGVEALLTLEEMIRERRTIAQFEEDHPNAFEALSNFVESRWVQTGEQSGGFVQEGGFPKAKPDIWGTCAALDIAFFLSWHLFETDPAEAKKWVALARRRTPDIFKLLQETEYRGGGYGFYPDSGVSNAFSMDQVAQIVDRLFFFNHPSKTEDAEAKEKFIKDHGFEPQRQRLVSILAAMPNSEGLSAGYLTRESAARIGKVSKP